MNYVFEHLIRMVQPIINTSESFYESANLKIINPLTIIGSLKKESFKNIVNFEKSSF